MRLHETLTRFADIVHRYEVIQYDVEEQHARLKLRIFLVDGPSVVRFVVGWKVPSPFPNKMETFWPWLFATTTSWFPSPSRSPIATAHGFAEAGKCTTEPKDPIPSPRRIEAVPPLSFAAARSRFPSLLSAPMKTERTFPPTRKLVARPTEPVPSPRRIEILLLSRFATAKSGFPSLLRSPIATETGKVWTG